MSRGLPALSVMGVLQVLSADQVTVAGVAAPVSSLSGSGVPRVAPVALFQFAFGTTPALSPTPIEVPLPTKLMLIAPPTLAVLTISATVAVRMRDPLVPVMVSVPLPAGVFAAVVTINVALPGPVIKAGVKDAVAFAGSPLTVRLTMPANPFSALVVTV